jgi:tetrahydromethanopterin S-methyltransferase subunit A
VSKSELMDKVALVGRLLSENKGIDAIIKFTLAHPELDRIIVCGREVKGHKAGQALLSLYKNGIDRNGRIIATASPYPILKSSMRNVEAFRKQIVIINAVGTEDIEVIKALVS